MEPPLCGVWKGPRLVDEVTLEHRLTTIELRQSAGFERVEAGQKSIEVQIFGIREEFKRLNGSVQKTQEKVARLEETARVAETETAYIKRWGARGTAAIVLMIGLAQILDIIFRPGGIHIPGLIP